MNKLISVVTAVVLAIITVVSISAAAYPGSAARMPIIDEINQAVSDSNTVAHGSERSEWATAHDLGCLESGRWGAQESSDSDRGAIAVAMADRAFAHSAAGPPAQEPEGAPDPQAMEALRADLLSLADILNELTSAVQPTAKLNGRQPPPKINKDLVERLSHEELDIVRRAIRDATGGDEAIFKDAIETLKALDLTPGKGFSPKGFGTEKEAPEGKEGFGVSPQFFTVIPTPTPTSPGINHRKDQGMVDRENDALGDLPPPDYATSAGCPTNRFPPPALLALRVVADVFEAVSVITEDICEVLILVFGAGTNTPACIVETVTEVVWFAAAAVIDGLEFCDGNVDAAEIEATYENTVRIHLELHDHDLYLQQRADTIDRFLFDFRNLDLRLDIEANLASNDAPARLFMLPNSVCISGVTNPERKAFKPGCGLLEVVSDTVRSTIDMYEDAGESTHAAEDKFNLAVSHYNANKYKLSYGRFREAYKEAVRQ